MALELVSTVATNVVYTTFCHTLNGFVNIVSRSSGKDIEEDELLKKLEHSDIHNQLYMIESLLTELDVSSLEIPTKQLESSPEDHAIVDHTKKSTLQKSVCEMFSLIRQLRTDLSCLHSRQYYNNSLLLFAVWRKKDVKEIVQRIISHATLLSNRFMMFEKMLAVSKHIYELRNANT